MKRWLIHRMLVIASGMAILNPTGISAVQARPVRLTNSLAQTQVEEVILSGVKNRMRRPGVGRRADDMYVIVGNIVNSRWAAEPVELNIFNQRYPVKAESYDYMVRDIAIPTGFTHAKSTNGVLTLANGERIAVKISIETAY